MNTEQWVKLIQRRIKWVRYNFPGPDMPNSLIGMIEEMGEMAHGHLKLKQNIRNDQDHNETITDSIGDIVIYMLGLMSAMGTVPKPLDERARRPYRKMPDDPDRILALIAAHIGELCYLYAMDSNATVDAQYRVDSIVHWLTRYCEVTGRDFETIVMTTWEQVEERDWIKYPVNGRPPVEVRGDVQEVTSVTATGDYSTGKGLHGQTITGE